jgi:hypothetical protein
MCKAAISTYYASSTYLSSILNDLIPELQTVGKEGEVVGQECKCFFNDRQKTGIRVRMRE